MYGRRKKLRKLKKIKHQKFFSIKKAKKEIKDTIVRDIWTFLETEEVKNERRKSEKKKKINRRQILEHLEILIRDIRTLFEQEEDY